MFHRSFSCIEQLNAAYKRQEKTGFDHFSKRYLYMYYTDAHIRPRMNTTSTRIYGFDEQRRQSIRKSARRLSTGNTRAMVGRSASSTRIEVFMNDCRVIISKRTCGVFWTTKMNLKEK